ncbi:MAG: DegV family protein [Raoultibacter sp.]
MTTQKIALITDSCTDVPAELAQRFHILTAPLTINYKDASYRDRVEISPEEVYARFSEEIPKTSLPVPADINALFEQAISEGCTHAVVVTISSGLSGTFDIMRHLAATFPTLETAVIDTKSIGFGAGISVCAAGEYIEAGLPFEEVVAKTQAIVKKTHVFFCVDTLEYLYAGGRINKATYQLGSMLDLRPILTCDDSGVYVPAGKARGRKGSLKKTLTLAQASLQGSQRYRVAVVHGDAQEEADAIVKNIRATFPNATEVYTEQISPALVVHTGRGLIGIGAQALD